MPHAPLTAVPVAAPADAVARRRRRRNGVGRSHRGANIWINGDYNPVQYGLLQFNGHNRFDQRDGTYFNNVQPWQHHENTPRDGVNVYSFALYPEQHQPSGTANFSRIDSSQLTLTYNDPTQSNVNPSLQYFTNGLNQVYIFATNYNIFRIFSGLSSLAYSQ